MQLQVLPLDKKKPLIEPLYTVADAQRALENVVGLKYREQREILPGKIFSVTASYWQFCSWLPFLQLQK